MSLELLANELLLYLFQFVNGVHLLRAFHNLNFRFDRLLIVHFQTHGLDFRSVSKYNFDIIRQQHLPSITDQIIALCLSNGDDTPQQIDLFLSNNFALRRFIHLRSLSLDSICSIQTMNKVIRQCRHLPCLIHLKFMTCCLNYKRAILLDTFNQIWNLPKLTHCYLDIINYSRFVIPTVVSTSIEYLTLKNTHLDFFQIVRLFRCTSNIRHLNVNVKDSSDNKQLRSSVSSICSLELRIVHSPNLLNNLLQNMPNLYHLIIRTIDIDINGHQWKQIIVEYLPKLKVFRFEMRYRLDDFDSKEGAIDRILDSYKTPFWLIDRQWFVRCRWNPIDKNDYIRLYTLPYAFGFFATDDDHFDIQTKSTYSVHGGYGFNEARDELRNAQNLHLMLPFDNRFLFKTQRFELTSLTVQYLGSSDPDSTSLELQNLIDRMHRLYSLTVGQWWSSPVQQLVSNITSHSIRSLNLLTYGCSDFERSFDNQQCVAFIHSPLGAQCEVLKIVVENRTCILELINGMTNLRALKVWCLDDKWYNALPFQSVDDELIEWLRSHLSCIIIREDRCAQYIRLWVR